MIGKLRRKLILISIAVTTAVFSAIFLFIFAISASRLERTMNATVDRLAASLSYSQTTPKSSGGYKRFYKLLTSESSAKTESFKVYLDENGKIEQLFLENSESVDEKTAKELFALAREQESRRGWAEDFRFKFYEVDGKTAAVFVDGEKYRTLSRTILLITGIVLFFSDIFVISLTAAFSKIVTRPYVKSFEKQKQFITDANHELKTPLTLILANLDIVEGEFGKNEWLDDIRSESERMGSLINELAVLASMDEDQKRPQGVLFDLSSVVEELREEFLPLAQKRNLSLESRIESGIELLGDEPAIRKLLSILFENATEYCDENGEIFISLSKKKHVVLSVENTFEKVGELELERLFDRFYRADKARTYHGNFGLGLSIARSVAENHGGEISAFGRDGKIVFEVVLKQSR